MPINLTSMLVPALAGTFPLLEDTSVRGGLQSVASVFIRDSIPISKRKVGMLVTTQDTTPPIVWQLQANLVTWLPFGLSIPGPTGPNGTASVISITSLDLTNLRANILATTATAPDIGAKYMLLDGTPEGHIVEWNGEAFNNATRSTMSITCKYPSIPVTYAASRVSTNTTDAVVVGAIANSVGGSLAGTVLNITAGLIGSCYYQLGKSGSNGDGYSFGLRQKCIGAISLLFKKIIDYGIEVASVSSNNVVFFRVNGTDYSI